MFAKRIVKVGVPIFAATTIMGVYNTNSHIKNEPKRKFYEDEVDVVPRPGTVVPASGTELEALGPNKIVEGISVRSPTAVESFFKSGREITSEYYTKLQGYINQGYSKYNETERQVTDSVSALHNRSEDLLPNSIYIVIATLSGNIAARQRGVISKITFPVILGIASFKYFLPQTYINTKNFIWKLEQDKLPQVAEQQVFVYNQADSLVKTIEQTSDSSIKTVESSIQSLRKSIADITGLNIDEEVSKK
ncbi:apolipo protein O-domain-containing protein [Scheffersomyces coipomensis]|uniref:apolipo protein O-domain-containing protein n=1 Tax=Scheffersomyces coipomensis TaxID=1788519 RepID=UPI00315E0169